MSDAIIVALISGGLTSFTTILVQLVTGKRNNDLIMYQINELKQKTEKHNNLIDRMYKIENRVTLLEDEMKSR